MQTDTPAPVKGLSYEDRIRRAGVILIWVIFVFDILVGVIVALELNGYAVLDSILGKAL